MAARERRQPMRVNCADRYRSALIAIGVSLALAACASHEHKPSALGISYVSEYKKVDAKGKGQVTFAEASDYYSRKFQELDTAKRGYLLAPDLASMLPLMGADSPDALLARLDNNGDGKVTLNEFMVLPNWLFQNAHKNPGVLTLDDVTAAAAETNGGPLTASTAGRGQGGRRGGGSGGSDGNM